MAEGDTVLLDRVQVLEQRLALLTAQVGTDTGQQQTPTQAEFDRVLQQAQAQTAAAEQNLRTLAARFEQVLGALVTDATIATAFTQAGLQVGNLAITDLAGSKITGDIATAQMQTNVVAAANANGGDLATATMDGNVIAAINASSGGGDFGKFNTGNISTSGTAGVGNTTVTGTAVVTSTLTAQGTLTMSGALDHNGTTVGFYGTAPVAQQTVAQMTNNVASGGTANTIGGWTVPQAFGTVEQTILDNYYQLGEKVKQLETAVRTLGLTKN